ncbi:FkbM family methyltransferase [Microbulbifer bruguierae]|uniref:FkbM family methyltransferase n=1 Tax=Microbulbifer bruguierae TaxID=3029061 RepID=A0ABY8NIJ9_9GAMM|nr:FkbM family methyltransferase [Microbulbifer bruguierae]WGL17552.1 FkbM family methyltransferase [Microbulbifer bruguierae]
MLQLENTLRCISYRLFGYPRLPFLKKRDDPGLRDSISTVLSGYYKKNIRRPPIVASKREPFPIDVNKNHIESALHTPEIHDGDFIIFGAFKESRSLILDIGANWGYSVRSMRSSGAECKIVSCEPVHYYESCLQRIFELHLGFYDYHMIGLSDKVGIINLVVPVINQVPAFGLATGLAMPNLNVFAKNIEAHIHQHIPNLREVYVQLTTLKVKIDTMDNLVDNNICRFVWNDIAAIKIDVEGMELEVLKGGIKTLRKYTPLIMLEGGNRYFGVS